MKTIRCKSVYVVQVSTPYTYATIKTFNSYEEAESYCEKHKEKSRLEHRIIRKVTPLPNQVLVLTKEAYYENKRRTNVS